jgi:hypothetical protein
MICTKYDYHADNLFSNMRAATTRLVLLPATATATIAFHEKLAALESLHVFFLKKPTKKGRKKKKSGEAPNSLNF